MGTRPHRKESNDPHQHRTPGLMGEPMEAKGTPRLKTGLAEMLKGGVIMDVTTAEQAKIAEEAGAVAVMALERVPADIRAEGGVARIRTDGLSGGQLELSLSDGVDPLWRMVEMP